MASALHMFNLEIGWQFELYKGLTLRTALGLAATLGAETQVQPDFLPISTNLSRIFTKDAEDYLNDIYQSFVHTPTIGISLSYRL